MFYSTSGGFSFFRGGPPGDGLDCRIRIGKHFLETPFEHLKFSLG
jgi:hypothetical protein